MNAIDVLLVGIGGYGQVYARAMLEEGEALGLRLAGTADPFPHRCAYYEQLSALAPNFQSMGDFFASGGRADLCVIATPIQFHAPMIEQALAHGCHVLCEKPLCATLEDADRLCAAQSGRLHIAVGYQWSYASGLLRLKEDILSGVFGRLKRARTLVLWPRDLQYYARGIGWAGKLSDAQGRPVLDSVANNATAHYLFNMFYLCGKPSGALEPEWVQAELYRANAIENYDTIALTAGYEDAEFCFYATHASRDRVDPSFVFEFERATVRFGPEEGLRAVIRAQLSDGSAREYAPVTDREECEKLRQTIRCIRAEEQSPLCPPSAAAVQTRIINAAQRSSEIRNFPCGMVTKAGEPPRLYVRELDDILRACYRQGGMPSAMGADWAEPAARIPLL